MIFANGYPISVLAGSLSTIEIANRSHSVDCLDWKIVGACVWLKCSFFGCYTVTTPRISHYLPDFVVSAYPQTGQSPWSETQALNQITSNSGFIVSGGNIVGTGTSALQHDSLQFHEVDIIGNPIADLNKYGKFLCKSDSEPIKPYFLSTADAKAWRSGLPDANRVEAKTPGMREVGDWPKFSWGSIYPRSGFLIQRHPGKAAAVSCQRAVDVLLKDSSGHTIQERTRFGEYSVIRGDRNASNKDSCQNSGGNWAKPSKHESRGKCVQQNWRQWLTNSNEKTDRWQMLLPEHDSRCETFGKQEEWKHDLIAENGKYIWNYWRQYKCCIQTSGILLSSFDF